MKRRVNLLILLVLFFGEAYPATITHYNTTFIPLFTEGGHLKIAIRQFQRDGQDSFLIVDPYNYKTAVIAQDMLSIKNPQAHLSEKVENTPYVKSLVRYTKYSGSIENSGVVHASNPEQGMFLTVDMCPSKHAFEEKFYQQLAAIGDMNHESFPVAISLSGLWLTHHQDEFQSLLAMQRDKKINITWVNHSMSHPYFPHLPLNMNFLLFRLVHLKYEILATEKKLLQADQTPSVFFRLPGLVANKHLLQELKMYGLIPLGADAWLAKDQKPGNGSIILVHGNGNEHQGIVDVMPYLQDPSIHWLPLVKALPD